MRSLHLLAGLLVLMLLDAVRGLLPSRALRRVPRLRLAGAEDDDDFDIEKVVRDIQDEQENNKRVAKEDALEEKRAVLKKRKDRQYEQFWERSKEQGLQSKQQVTLDSYYNGRDTYFSGRNGTQVSNSEGAAWDYTAAPVSVSKGDGVPAVVLGLAVLGALLVGKKLMRQPDDDNKKKKKRVRNAINMPGIGPVWVD
jgi:hypothetical protein